MVKFVEALNTGGIPGAALPAGVVARYQMEWEKVSVSGGGGQGPGGGVSTHKVLFFREMVREMVAPPTVQLMERKLPHRGEQF